MLRLYQNKVKLPRPQRYYIQKDIRTLVEKKSTRNKVERTATNQPQIESIREKLAWFNDPHLLSERISRLSQKKEITSQMISDKIIDLIQRHTGSSNSVVIASAMSNLSRLGQFDKVLTLFEIYRERNLQPTEAAYTLLIQSLINISDDVCSHQKKLELAQNAYEKMEKSAIHLNIMLQFLAFHKSEEATVLGIKIFQDQIHQADNRSFSHSFKLLQFSSSMRPEDLNTLEKRKITSDNITQTQNISPANWEMRSKLPHGLKYINGSYAIDLFKLAESKQMIDDLNLNEFMGIFRKISNNHKTKEHHRIYQQNLEFVVKVIKDYYGLPFSTMQSKLKNSTKFREINTKQFLNLLFLANHIHKTKLGIHWYDILSSKLEMDTPIKLTLLKMLKAAKMFSRALKLSNELNDGAPDGLKLRVLNKSIKTDFKNRQKYFEEANQIYMNESKTWRVQYNMLLIFISMKKWADAMAFLISRQDIFIRGILPVGKKEKKFVYDYYELVFRKYQMKGFKLDQDQTNILAAIVEFKRK